MRCVVLCDYRFVGYEFCRRIDMNSHSNTECTDMNTILLSRWLLNTTYFSLYLYKIESIVNMLIHCVYFILGRMDSNQFSKHNNKMRVQSGDLFQTCL